MNVDKDQRRTPRPIDTKPEFGDAIDVRHLFGIRPTKLYELHYAALIKSKMITTKGRARGKRFYDLNSIRELLG